MSDLAREDERILTAEPRGHGDCRYSRGPDENGQPGKGCRCPVCRHAHTRYVGYRDLMIATGRWKPFVPADRARAHLLILAANGISAVQVANLTGLHAGTIKVILGQPGRRVAKVRPATEAAILSIDPDPANIYDGTLVPAVGTQRRLQALIYAGWSISRLASELGLSRSSIDIWMRAFRVTAGTARKVAALADRLWDMPPPKRTRWERGVATRARAAAQANGWVPLIAWDDDGENDIDDPDAKPAEGWRRDDQITTADRLEEAAELAGWGFTDEQAADRLGIAKDTLQAARNRATAKAETVAA